MGKSAPSAPPPPDPVATANAQTVSNKDTARTNAALNRVNQFGPDGSIVYGSNAGLADQWMADSLARDREAHAAQGKEWSEAGAKEYFTQRNPYTDTYNVTTQLSPESQRIYDLTRSAQTQYGQVGNAQLGAVRDTLSEPFRSPYASTAQDAISRASATAGQPFNVNYDQVRQQALDANMARLEPQFARDEEAMRSRLLAQGIGQGSKAWETEYGTFNQGRNDARQQAILSANDLANQSIQQAGALRSIPLNESGQLLNLAGVGMQQKMAERSQPLNETAALLTGQQVSMPSFQNVPQVQMAPTDVIGANNMAYQGQLAAFNAANQRYNAGMSGAFGLAGSLGSAALLGFSDRRLKSNIHRIGKTPGGASVYSYRYKADPEGATHIGVMAQELMKTQPDAVMRDRATGYLAVDYAKVA